MKTIDVLTFTLGGRDRYLFRCLDSVYNDIHEQLIQNEFGINHHLILQGEKACEFKEKISGGYFADTGCYKLIVHSWP
jgi:hypothetical protein